MPFDLAQLLVIEFDQTDIQLNAFAGAGVFEALGQALSVEGIAQVFPDLWMVILTIGIMNVSQQFRTLAHQVHAPAHEVAGGAHFCRVDIGHGEHAAAYERGDFMGIDLVVLRLAAMNGAHIEGMAENKGNALFFTQVGYPVPGKHAFDADNQVLPVRLDCVQQGMGCCLDVFVQDDLTIVVEDTQIQAASMKINSAIKVVLFGVEFH